MGESRTHLRTDDGFTLLETLVVMVAGLAVLVAILSTGLVAIKQQDQVSKRVDSFDRIDLAFDRLQDDVREAHGVSTSSGGWRLVVTLPRPVAGQTQLQTVTWACDVVAGGDRRCTRTAGTSTAEVVLEGVQADAAPFTLDTTGAAPRVTVDLAARTGADGAVSALRSKLAARPCQTADVLACS